jgi:hypothetical protein
LHAAGAQVELVLVGHSLEVPLQADAWVATLPAQRAVLHWVPELPAP